jgi:hypothetical protein
MFFEEHDWADEILRQQLSVASLSENEVDQEGVALRRPMVFLD